MKRWVSQAYLYHFGKIPMEDLSVDWTSHLSDYSVVIELQIFKKYKTELLPTLQEFIDGLNKNLKEGEQIIL